MTTKREISKVMSTIGRMAAGKSKNYSEEELRRRRERMEAMNLKRRKSWSCASCGEAGCDDYAEVKGEAGVRYCVPCGKQLMEMGREVEWMKV